MLGLSVSPGDEGSGRYCIDIYIIQKSDERKNNLERAWTKKHGRVGGALSGFKHPHQDICDSNHLVTMVFLARAMWCLIFLQRSSTKDLCNHWNITLFFNSLVIDDIHKNQMILSKSMNNILFFFFLIFLDD